MRYFVPRAFCTAGLRVLLCVSLVALLGVPSGVLGQSDLVEPKPVTTAKTAGDNHVGSLDREAILAQALREGYGERAEVRAEVERMERHMLTQVRGPFYQRLCAGKYALVPDAAVLYERGRNVYEVEIARAPHTAPVAVEIRDAGGEATAEEWAHRFALIRASGQAQCFSGSIGWPFLPFEEIAPEIERAELGLWRQVSTDEDVFFYRVLSRKPAERPPLDAVGPGLARVARHIAEREVLRERQGRVLREAGFSFDWAVAGQIADRLGQIDPPPRSLELQAFADLQTAVLGRLHKDGIEQSVTVADYVRYFNDRFVRRIPRKAIDIYDDARALVVAEKDCEEARALGLDREPKFSAERENYRNNLVFELYQKERIRPKLSASR